MNLPKKIDAMFAWVTTENTGQEGIGAAKLGEQWMPMIGADREHIDSLRPYAELIAQRSDVISVRLMEFTTIREVESLPILRPIFHE